MLGMEYNLDKENSHLVTDRLCAGGFYELIVIILEVESTIVS